MAHNNAKLAEVAARRTQLIKLRLQGVRFDDERILALGYTTSGSARKDLIRALAAHVEDEKAAASVYRQQENERLDALLEAVWDRATVPHPVFDREGVHLCDEIDVRAVDTVIRLIDRRAKLNGLDILKAELSGPGGGPVPIGPVGIAELRELIRTAGDPDEDDDESPDDPDDSDSAEDEAGDDDGDDAS